MTRITSKEIECPHCGHHYKILWEASINTWLDPDLIQKVIDDIYYYACPECGKETHLVTKILITCPKGMFWISNDEDIATKIKIFLENEIINEDGDILRPTRDANPPAGNHPALVSDLGKSIKKFRDNLLNESDQGNNEK